MSVDFVAYHDRTGDDHQIQFNRLYNGGYRMISLSVYNPESPLYAAVWVKRAGPPWAAIHGASADTWQIFFNQWAAQGFHPIILTAAGPVNSAVFAAVVEQRPGPIPLTRHHLISGPDTDPNSIQYWNKQAQTNGWRLDWAAYYGDALQPRFAGIWPTNPNGVIWNTGGISDSSDDYQRRFDAQVSAWARPAFVTLSGTQRYLSVFTDDQIGEWVARHNMTSSGYQTEFNSWVALGFYPIRVQAAGSGSAARFAAIFAKQEEPIARQWSVTGSPAVQAIDQAMQSTMQTYRVRGAALSVLKGTKLVLARGYTWAEPSYPIIQPTTLFRVASCSKTITAIAIHQLISEGKLNPTDTLQSVLNLTGPDGAAPVDPRFGSITIQNLLEQNSGLVPEYSGEDPQVIQAWNAAHPNTQTQLPATPQQLAAHMVTKWMNAAPGTNDGSYIARPGNATYYSNFGYWLLGQVVAVKRGKSDLVAAIQTKIIKPLKIRRMRSSRSLVSAQLADEARYHSPDLQLVNSVMSPDQPWVGREYGDENMERMEASGGLSVAVVDFARVLAALNLPGSKRRKQTPVGLSRSEVLAMLRAASNSYRGHGFDSMIVYADDNYQGQKGGLLQTSQNSIYFTNDISFVICWNQVNVGGDWYPSFPEVVNAAQAASWGSTDLFPSYGMPSF